MRIVFKDNKFMKGSIKYYVLSFSYKDCDILNLDRQGRVISFVKDNGTLKKVTYKKGFDGTLLGIKRSLSSNPRHRFTLTQSEIKEVYDYISHFCSEFVELLQNRESIITTLDTKDAYKDENLDSVLDYWINVLKQFSIDQNTHDQNLFPQIYTSIGILPPDRYGSLVYQVTTGCVYNKCAFCTLYQGIDYTFKSVEEVRKHIIEISNFMGESLGRFHSIFLGDANALMIPFDVLLAIFKLLNEELNFSEVKVSYLEKKKPAFEGIYSFLDVFTGFKLSANHFTELAKLNLKMVYLGIETGSERVLKLLNKPNTKEKILKVVNDLHEASIGVAVIFLIGAGGKNFADEHIKNSLELIKELDLRKSDIVYLSKLFIYENSLLQKNMVKYNIQPLTDEELEAELTVFRRELDDFYVTKQQKPLITRYEILDFIY